MNKNQKVIVRQNATWYNHRTGEQDYVEGELQDYSDYVPQDEALGWYRDLVAQGEAPADAASEANGQWRKIFDPAVAWIEFESVDTE